MLFASGSSAQELYEPIVNGPNLNETKLNASAVGFPFLEPQLQELQPAPSTILLPQELPVDEVLPVEEILPLDPPTNQNDDFEILTRGTLHEAFASAHRADPQASPLVSQAPPAVIDEVPPEYKPDGNNIQWIPGYWAWDDAQTDFIWISGVWRDVPPGRQWVPGYWNEDAGQHRWISGFWSEQQNQVLGYLPVPPASLDNGPSVQRPNNDHFYVPGNWDFQDNNYRWLSGHWQPIVQNHIWIPARYVWTPHGCVYVSGYWDYEIDYRGTCFAPIHFRNPVCVDQPYVYRPSYVVNVDVDFLTHLFVRPHCGHYYFGDWYGDRYSSQGYQPWCNYGSHHRRYDPLLTYYRSRPSSFDLRFNVVQYLAQQHGRYASNQNFRPRPTFSGHQAFVNTSRNKSHHQFAIRNDYVKNFDQLRRQRDQQVRNAQQVANQRARNQARFHKLELQEQIRINNNRDAFVRAQNERRKAERRNEQNRAQRQAQDRQRQIERDRQNAARERARNDANRQAQEIADRQRNADRQRDSERQRNDNAQRQRNTEQQRQTQARVARENTERQRQANAERQQRTTAERLRQTQAQAAREATDRQRNANAQRQRDTERQRYATAERLRETRLRVARETNERQQKAAAERQRQTQAQAARETVERQRKANAQRQRDTERQRNEAVERQRQAQARAARENAERQQRANAERQRQQKERQRTAERQRNAERQRDADRKRQQQRQQQERQRKQREQRNKNRK